MSDFDPLLDTSLPELFDAERPKHASAEAAWAAIAGRAIGAYAVAQAERDHLRRALEDMAATSPPDDWEWYAGCGDYEGFGRRGDRDYVEAPDTSNSDDMHAHGWACGRWGAARLARAALAATEEGSDAT